MATGLEALGAAAAVSQLIDYGIELTAGAISVYKSSHGTTRELEDLRQMTQQFRDSNKDMLSRYQRLSAQGVVDRGLERVVQDCNGAASDLLQLLADLHVKGSRSIGKSVSAAFKIKKRQGTIQRHQSRLQQLRQQLHEQLLRSINDSQTTLGTTLTQIGQQQTALGASLPTQFEQLKHDLLAAVKGKQDQGLTGTLSQAQGEGERIVTRQKILKSLYYDEIRHRRERIKDPNQSTYEWIFGEDPDHSPPLRYCQWLKEHNGIYWVTGKAGCGKSTLMKFIANDERTSKALDQWAKGRKLTVASHYFWYLGASMQKSFEGLLQSILFDILRHNPEAIDLVCQSRMNDPISTSMPWALSELCACVESLAKSNVGIKGQGLCFCFFLDGLDEYDGEHDEVVKVLQKLAQADNIKICASSRPWEVFQDSFAESTERQNRLVLHHHTRNDIANVVQEELDPFLTKRNDDKAQLDCIVSEIIDKAQGVFLWVVLVIRKELIEGFRYAASIRELRARLEKIPQGLEQYFDLIFDRIPAFYRQDTARIFKCCLEASQPLPVLALDILTSDNPMQEAIDASSDSHHQWTSKSIIEESRKRLSGRCQDLLMVDDTWFQTRQADVTEEDRVFTIEFLHRSVADYLKGPKMSQMLDERGGAAFSPDETLFGSYVFLIKKSHQGRMAPNFDHPAWGWSDLALGHAFLVPYSSVSAELISQVDVAMSKVVRPSENVHWSAIRDNRRLPMHLYEQEKMDFLALLIENDLQQYAEPLIKARGKDVIKKQGRPYLDYCLRPKLNDRMNMWYIYGSFTPHGCFPPHLELARVLISAGCDVNEEFSFSDGRTIWDLFLEYMYESKTTRSMSDLPPFKDVTWLLIDSGATNIFRCKVVKKVGSDQVTDTTLSVEKILKRVFGQEEGANMCEAADRNSSKGWTRYFKFW